MTRKDYIRLAETLRNTKLTEKEQALLDALRKEAEGCDDAGWKDVYLDNIPLRITDPKSFAGLTGSLTKKGLYRQEDDAWAMVRMQAAN